MLEQIDLSCAMDKKAYNSEIEELELKLKGLQQTIKEYKIPVLIVFEGWSASGKGTFINKLLYPLDPRDFNVYTMDKMTEEKAFRPFLWSYWIKTPLKGRITIFDKSWYRAALPEGIEKWNLTDRERNGFYYDANAFEKQLSDDGTLIIKFFLHISKAEQKKRFQTLAASDATKWRIDAADWEQNTNYEKILKHFDSMIEQSNLGETKWSVIEAEDKKFATVKVYKTLIDKIEREIAKRDAEQVFEAESAPVPPTSAPSILNTVDPNKQISENEYKEKLKFYQNKISYLGYMLYAKRVPVVIVYEGWDAAGKGGNIKRLTQELDPRGYEVVPVPAPTLEELNHHYLWRFWNKMPKDGHIAIFDRSWYGRVMVERIEGYATEEQWKRAYEEINDMELHMANHGVILFKFWMHIDKDEQLLRFQARESDPLKNYKITDEDWRNREKWGAYEIAVNEMLFKTSTDYAPWTIVESNNKKYARIKTMAQVAEVLEKKLMG